MLLPNDTDSGLQAAKCQFFEDFWEHSIASNLKKLILKLIARNHCECLNNITNCNKYVLVAHLCLYF